MDERPPATRETILKMLRSAAPRGAGDVAAELGISRQAAHRHLKALVKEGLLVLEGKARASKYRDARALPLTRRYPRAVIAEDRVWDDLASQVPSLHSLLPDALSIFQYAFTEMLNNAIEHSEAETVEVRFEEIPDGLAFEITDGGRGVFANLRKVLHMHSDMEALQELTKGKLTTLPQGHTGEGIFFTSKAGDRFELESGTLRWTVDNLREDFAVGEVSFRAGTRVRFEAPLVPRRRLAAVFAEYTKDLQFQKTRVVVKLFTLGARFISRSEARRVLHGLERFQEAILDFRKVDEVGQGFVDEVFRVWAGGHPATSLTTTNMNAAVAFMVTRTRGAGPR